MHSAIPSAPLRNLNSDQIRIFSTAVLACPKSDAFEFVLSFKVHAGLLQCRIPSDFDSSARVLSFTLFFNRFVTNAIPEQICFISFQAPNSKINMGLTTRTLLSFYLNIPTPKMPFVNFSSLDHAAVRPPLCADSTEKDLCRSPVNL